MGSLARSEDAPAAAVPVPVAAIGLLIGAGALILASSSLADVTQQLTCGGAFVVGSLHLGDIRLSQTFVGLVVLPLIGSLGDNMNSVRAAMKGNAAEAVGSTAGSAIQVALIAVPIFILFSYFILQNNSFDLLFTRLELFVIGLGAFIYYLVVEDGKGTWLEGCLLLITYGIFAAAAYFV